MDYLDLRLGKKLASNVYDAECKLFNVPVIAKFARFPFQIDSMNNEAQVYEWIDGRGIGPGFLGHLTEEGRVIGFLLEKVDGKQATIDDGPVCEAVILKLHGLDIIHNDLSKDNFLVSDSCAVLLGFKTAKRSNDRTAMVQELRGLGEQLHQQAKKEE